MALGEMMAIADEVARERRVTVADMRGHSRCRPLFLARAEAMRRIRATGRYSYPQIAAFFWRDHTTVINAVRQAERALRRVRLEAHFAAMAAQG